MKTIKTDDGERYFAFKGRGKELEVVLDAELAKDMTDELAKLAMDNCPVGSIIYKETAFTEPIGTRKYDKEVIGSDIDV